MNNDTPQRSLIVWVLIILHFLLGLGAAISGGFLILAPDGHLMQMPLDMLGNTPFSDFLFPGNLYGNLSPCSCVQPVCTTFMVLARPGQSLQEHVLGLDSFVSSWSRFADMDCDANGNA